MPRPEGDLSLMWEDKRRGLNYRLIGGSYQGAHTTAASINAVREEYFSSVSNLTNHRKLV